jgi:hypothetical protein
MRMLLELAELINKNKIKDIEMIDKEYIIDDRVMKEFYNKLLKKSFETDDEAAYYFYKEDASKPAYRQLKHRIKRKLLTTLLQIDFNQKGLLEHQKVYYSTIKEWASMNILGGKGFVYSAALIARKIIKNSIKYHSLSFAVEAIRYAKMEAVVAGDHIRFAQIEQEETIILQQYNMEVLAEQLMMKVNLYLGSTRYQEPAYAQTIQTYIDQLTPLLPQVQFFPFKMNYYMLCIIQKIIERDNLGAIKVIEEALAYFHTEKYTPIGFLSSLYIVYLECCVEIRDFQRGHKNFQNGLRVSSEGRVNWFYMHRLYFLLCMHTEHYAEANEVLQTIAAHSSFDYLSEKRQETWRIAAAYNYFLNGHLPDISNKLFSKAKISRFLNDVPEYSKDKRGYNVAIIIVKMLFLLQNKKEDAVLDLVERLQVYCTRYLKDKQLVRSNAFIKMLNAVARGNFVRHKVEKYAAPHLRVLYQNGFQNSQQSNQEAEIVPYENLWKEVCKFLK